MLLREKHNFDEDFAAKMVGNIQNLRESKKLVFIDCGGIIDLKNHSILSACTHAILISANEAAATEWKNAISEADLELIAEIISVNTTCFEELPGDIFRLGKFFRNECTAILPDILIYKIIN